ncbi:MAG: hypothetical protein L6Q37_00825 [Bdellovibrionaceae bacterium]|nr:hypothetical protein [Pseudobdellovibrionaceae bacterium]NUM58940.1 hypothetical protein [Pseudobdellovibrionaceae bacterium]
MKLFLKSLLNFLRGQDLISKSNLLVFLTLSSLFFVNACSFDKNNPTEDRARQREKDSQRLTQNLKPIEGKYEGKLEFYDRPKDNNAEVSLTLSLEQETVGVDVDGLPQTIPVLVAYYKRADEPNLGIAFKVDYKYYADPNGNNLFLTNPKLINEKSSISTEIEASSISGNISNDTITADVISQNNNGKIGKLTLKLVDKNVETTSLGARSSLNEKVLNIYRKVEGTYEGYIKASPSALNPILARIIIRATIEKDGKPTLKANLERLDLFPVSSSNQDLVVDYRTDRYPAQISLVSDSSLGFRFIGNVIFDENCVSGNCQTVLKGESVISKNLRANTQFVRKSDISLAENSAVIGKYKGSLTFKNSANQSKIPMEMIIFTQEEDGGKDVNGQLIRRPALKAYLFRSDIYNTGSIYSVSYNDLANPEKFNLVVFNPVNSNLEISALRGNFNTTNATFEAEVISKNGTVGTVSLKQYDRKTETIENLENQMSQNLLALYKNIQGTYEGIVDVDTKDVKPFDIKITLTPALTVGNKPFITGFFQRLDVPYGDLDLQLIVDYKADTFPQKIFMSNDVNGTSPKVYFFNFDGIIEKVNPKTKEVCDVKRTDCQWQIKGLLMLPKNRTSKVLLIKRSSK